MLNSDGSSGYFMAPAATPNNLLATLLHATPTPQKHRMQVSLHANMLDDWAVGVALMRLDMAMVTAKSPFGQHTHCRTVNVHDIIHGSAHLGPTCITSRQGSRGR
jgi:hypothetical protein